VLQAILPLSQANFVILDRFERSTKQNCASQSVLNHFMSQFGAYLNRVANPASVSFEPFEQFALLIHLKPSSPEFPIHLSKSRICARINNKRMILSHFSNRIQRNPCEFKINGRFCHILQIEFKGRRN
jgi:hypothetical protein